MHQSEIQADPARRPRLTVAAIVERDGRFLFVEERDPQSGALVLNQPAGHVEAGETLTEAVVREAYEEAGWHIQPEHLVGVYLWSRPDGAVSYCRVAIAGRAGRHDPQASLDEGIVRALWLTPDELAGREASLRSPLVLRCLRDYLAGERYPLSALKSLLAD
jgi:8-oxo-dGTP pyrophosphatase MutT (NUDIX family)